MGFSFSFREFLNDFSAGFVFIFGIVVTNLNYFSKYIQYADKFVVVLIVLMYIFGLIISSISYFVDMPFYIFFDRLIRKIKIKPINKFFYYIKMITLYFFFRRWTVVETFIRLKKKWQLPKEIAGITTYNELDILSDRISGTYPAFTQIDFFKAQFFQACGNSIVFIFLFNIIFGNRQMGIIDSLIYVFGYFFLKIWSPMFAKNYFLDIARKATALNLIHVQE